MRPKDAMVRAVVHSATKCHNATKVLLLRVFSTSHVDLIHKGLTDLELDINHTKSGFFSDGTDFF